MKKLYSIILALFSVASLAMADGEVRGVFNNSSSGTTSATAFVKPASEYSQITDLAWRLDSGVTTGLVFFRSGDVKYASTSATSASGTVVWFANAGTAVAAGEYIIINDVSAGDFFLRNVLSSTTTSATISESLSPALTTSDVIWSVVGSFARSANTAASPTAGSSLNIWLPKDVPTAVTVDGNTTACRISFSGIVTNYR